MSKLMEDEVVAEFCQLRYASDFLESLATVERLAMEGFDPAIVLRALFFIIQGDVWAGNFWLERLPICPHCRIKCFNFAFRYFTGEDYFDPTVDDPEYVSDGVLLMALAESFENGWVRTGEPDPEKAFLLYKASAFVFAEDKHEKIVYHCSEAESGEDD